MRTVDIDYLGLRHKFSTSSAGVITGTFCGQPNCSGIAMANTGRENLSIAHGVFNLTTGLWPVFHRRSFEAVTGPKTDFWLVRTVGLLIAATGVAMTLAGFRKRVTPEIRVLGCSVAGSLMAVDLIYGGSGRISRIYLGDAGVEAALTAAWLKQSW